MLKSARGRGVSVGLPDEMDGVSREKGWIGSLGLKWMKSESGMPARADAEGPGGAEPTPVVAPACLPFPFLDFA